MAARTVRNVVLGAGAVGSAAAYHLARRGEPVVLVEQFALGHDRGSSHGAARIIRHSYADPTYARLMPEAFRAWRELEADWGRPLYVRTGGVSISPRSVGYVEKVAENLASMGVPHRRMGGRDLNRAIPSFQVDGSLDVVFEPDAGLLAADRAVAAQVELARSIGGESTEVLEHSPALRVDLDGERPRVVLGGETLEAERLIVAAGAWTGRVIPELSGSLRPTRQRVLYFRPAESGPFAVGRFPVFIFMGEGPLDAYYGMPECLGMGVKAARHGGPDVDPDRADRAIEPDYVEEVRRFLARTVPGLADAPVDRAEVCLYTMAEGEHFRVGMLPGRSDVVVASPCSGHGFKFSTLMGRILVELAVDGRSGVELGPWGFY